jgi:hypothetical protein
LIMSIMWWCWTSQGLTINTSLTLYDIFESCGMLGRELVRG